MIQNLTIHQLERLPKKAMYTCDTCSSNAVCYLLVDSNTAFYICKACKKYKQLQQELQLRLLRENKARWLVYISKASIEELSKEIGVSRQAYHKWLNGEHIKKTQRNTRVVNSIL